MKNLMSFIHPVMMWGVLGLYLYTAYLGWQSRKIRFAKAETRKELVSNHFGFKHAQIAIALLGLLILGGIIGLIVTYINTGTVLSSGHGKIGILMMLLIVASSTLAPALRRGVAWARTTHMGIGILLLLLYPAQSRWH